jgi:hypothetical protein
MHVCKKGAIGSVDNGEDGTISGDSFALKDVNILEK